MINKKFLDYFFFIYIIKKSSKNFINDCRCVKNFHDNRELGVSPKQSCCRNGGVRVRYIKATEFYSGRPGAYDDAGVGKPAGMIPIADIFICAASQDMGLWING